MTKILTLALTLFCFSTAFSQEINRHEIKRLDRLGVSLDSIDRSDELDVLNLEALVKSDLQYRRRKRAGFILAGAGALITIVGIATIVNNDAEYEAKAYASMIGGAVITLGAGSAGLSIPLFNSSQKRKRQRDALIKILQEEERLVITQD